MQNSKSAVDRGSAEYLNQQCFCVTLDRDRLDQDLLKQEIEAKDVLTPAHRHLFSDTPVFVPRTDVAQMENIVEAIESASMLQPYRQAALSWAPEIAQFEPGPLGAFMGYDFHLGTDGPRLIEINTNAGGAFINAHLARAQLACCGRALPTATTEEDLEGFEDRVGKMFRLEWRRQGRSTRLASVAIVDDSPETQYLYLEFKLARQALQARGIDTLIVDPSELSYINGRLLARGMEVDLVYNRLVDFALEASEHNALRRAYLAGAAAVTPNPRVHALLADKRNLTLLSDGPTLQAWGLDHNQVQALEAAIPKTQLVTPENADALWACRRDLFFKPVAGHGSKGVYRGSKLTKGVFARIRQGGYIAQTYVPPSERVLRVDNEPTSLKVDVRLYTYAGENLLTAARIYQGQATNLRTPGGGFAPVFQL